MFFVLKPASHDTIYVADHIRSFFFNMLKAYQYQLNWLGARSAM